MSGDRRRSRKEEGGRTVFSDSASVERGFCSFPRFFFGVKLLLKRPLSASSYSSSSACCRD